MTGNPADREKRINEAGTWRRTPVLKSGEKVDDLQRDGLGIIRDPRLFCYGIDAVLLSHFAAAQEGAQVLDLCCGQAVISILMSATTGAAHLTGLEILPEMADLARRSVAMNALEEKITIVEGDIKEAGRIFPPASFDVVTCNPPYMKRNAGLTNPDDAKAVARHEILCDFEDVAGAAGVLLAAGGWFYLIHRPARLPELFGTLKKNGLEPKRMRLVHPFADQAPNMVLIGCVRGGRPELKIEKQLVIYEAPGIYTREVREIYGME